MSKDTETTAVESVQVSIYNQTYNLRSNRGREHVRRIAQLVDERMRQLSSQLATHDLSKIAILAAMNIADEMQSLKEFYESEAQELAQQSSMSAEPTAQAQSEREATEHTAVEREASERRSWFDAFFEAPVETKDEGARLSSQVSAKLQTRRQPNREGLIISADNNE